MAAQRRRPGPRHRRPPRPRRQPAAPQRPPALPRPARTSATWRRAAADPRQLVRAVAQSAGWQVQESGDVWNVTVPVGSLRKQTVTVDFARPGRRGPPADRLHVGLRAGLRPERDGPAAVQYQDGPRRLRRPERPAAGEMIVVQANQLATALDALAVSRILAPSPGRPTRPRRSSAAATSTKGNQDAVQLSRRTQFVSPGRRGATLRSASVRHFGPHSPNAGCGGRASRSGERGYDEEPKAASKCFTALPVAAGAGVDPGRAGRTRLAGDGPQRGRHAEERDAVRRQRGQDRLAGRGPAELRKPMPAQAKPQLIVLVDDDLRRTFFSSMQTQSIDSQADHAWNGSASTSGWPGALAACPRWGRFEVTPFDEWGRRIVTMQTGQGPVSIIQGITGDHAGLHAGRGPAGPQRLRLGHAGRHQFDPPRDAQQDPAAADRPEERRRPLAAGAAVHPGRAVQRRPPGTGSAPSTAFPRWPTWRTRSSRCSS